jgi:hypothetical protein
MESRRWEERALWRCGAIALLAAQACDGDLTELVVVVDTDLRVPEELDRVVLVADSTAIGGPVHERSAGLSGPGALALPLTLGLVHSSGPLGPIRVTALGRHGSEDVVARRAEVGFVARRSTALVLHLSRTCVGVRCAEGETCSEGVCRPAVVRPGELGPWPPASDAGIDRVDAGPGACSCTRPHATTSCSRGECTVTGCETGYDDCDGVPENGCETPLDTPSDCGRCRRACSLAHAVESCVDGACAVSRCEDGFGDCDREAATGCERRLDTLADCGSCGAPCARAHASATCAGGACRIAACEPGWADADGSDANGCEGPPACDASRCLCTSTCSEGSPCECSSGCRCELACRDDCRATCTGSATRCTVDAREISRFESFRCTRGAACTVDATGAERFDHARCEHGSDCDVDCTGVRECRLECRSGSRCLVRCSGSERCQLTDCHGGEMSCPGSILVCNRGCP